MQFVLRQVGCSATSRALGAEINVPAPLVPCRGRTRRVRIVNPRTRDVSGVQEPRRQAGRPVERLGSLQSVRAKNGRDVPWLHKKKVDRKVKGPSW